MAIPTADGKLINLVDLRDPVGAAIIGCFSHVAGEKEQRCRYLTWPQVRHDVRVCLARWGTLPDRIQTDNEAVFIGKPHSNFPSPFVLWTKGLGIDHVAIRPRHPTDNAEVERQHRTVYEYSLVGCTTPAAGLQPVLDQGLHDLNQKVPSQAQGCHGQPPLTAHPQLLQPRRPFAAELELAHFDWRGWMPTWRRSRGCARSARKDRSIWVAATRSTRSARRMQANESWPALILQADRSCSPTVKARRYDGIRVADSASVS